MIHLAYASLDLTTVMRSVWFPIQASRTPDRATICLTHKYIPAVEVLQAGSWPRSRRRCRCHTCITVAREASVLCAFPASSFPITSIRASARSFSVALMALSLPFCLILPQSAPLTATWNISWIDGNGIKETGVSEGEEGKKDRVYHKDADRWASARSVEGGGRSEEVIDC